MFLETGVESERLLDQTATVRLVRNGLRLLALLLIVIFAFWKNDVIAKEAALAGADAARSAAILAHLQAYALFSCAVALLAAAYCIHAVLTSVERESSDLYRRLGGGDVK